MFQGYFLLRLIDQPPPHVPQPLPQLTSQLRPHLSIQHPTMTSPRPILRLLSRTQTRAFTSHQFAPTPSPYSPTETSILSAALAHVPTHGFTTTSLALGSRDCNGLDITINLFPRGALDLVRYHLYTQREALKHRVDLTAEMGVTARIRKLCKERLRANEPVLQRWQEAIAIMSLAENIPTATGELARLADEMWYLAGDRSADTSWYTKRAMLGAVYASTGE